MCFSSGKSNTTRKAEKDRYLYNHSQTVIFQDRLVDGIMSVFILHAVAIAKKHYRQRSFLDTVLYLLKSTFFFGEVICKLVLNLSGRHIWSPDAIPSASILCKDVWKRFQLPLLHFVW